MDALKQLKGAEVWFARPEDEWAHKDATRYGGPKARGIARAGESAHQFFGFTLVTLPASLLLLRAAVARSRRRGTIIEY